MEIFTPKYEGDIFNKNERDIFIYYLSMKIQSTARHQMMDNDDEEMRLDDVEALYLR